VCVCVRACVGGVWGGGIFCLCVPVLLLLWVIVGRITVLDYPASLSDDDEVMLNVLRCQLTY